MIGTTLGHFEIVDLLGEGGMGKVYRALDPRLGREVAIKVLPEQFIADPDRLARFEREAQVVAQINHPNICALYDVGESEGQGHYLVMELVEGETLEERMARELPLEEAVNFAVQIAEALEAAHSQGIVHRDLKPANVKINPSGQVKVLDFGLAKARENQSTVAPELSHSPTLTARMTQHGVILGTAAYMSPEQARGGATDAQTDIWSWGVMLFEMISGERLFAEPTVSDTLAAVLRADFDWDQLPADLPENVEITLRRSLERSVHSRFHAIADARIELTEERFLAKSTEAIESPRKSGRTSHLLAWSLAILAVALLVWTQLDSRPAEPQKRVVAQLLPPDNHDFLFHSGLAIAPDGHAIVFGARDQDGQDRLWLRSLDSGQVESLPGTENGVRPFWSPDSQGLGFIADERMKVLSLRDGVVEPLIEASPRTSGAWHPSGVIVGTRRDGIFSIPSAGGDADIIHQGESDKVEFLCPFFLPGGSDFIYVARDYASTAEKNEIRIGSLEGGAHRTLLASNSCATYAPSGELIWWEGGHLRAQPFDLAKGVLTGSQRLLQKEVQFDPPQARAMFSVSDNGTLVFRMGSIAHSDQLVLVDRDGQEIRTISPPGNYYFPRLKPDGSMVAVDRSDETNRGDIWTFGVERGTGDRVTVAPQDESNPTWSPDGSRIAIYSTRLAPHGSVHLRSPRPGPEEELPWNELAGSLEPQDWSATGHLLVEYVGKTDRLQADLRAYSLAEDQVVSVAETQFQEDGGAFSPDADFIAYCSDETGRMEVFVQSFPDPSQRIRVSTGGGCGPVWKSDGSELYFANLHQEILAVTIRAHPSSGLEVGVPEVLFKTDMKLLSPRQFDTIDGEIFVLNRRTSALDSTPLTLVLHALPDGS